MGQFAEELRGQLEPHERDRLDEAMASLRATHQERQEQLKAAGITDYDELEADGQRIGAMLIEVAGSAETGRDALEALEEAVARLRALPVVPKTDAE